MADTANQKQSTSRSRAAEIMGVNFFDIGEAAKHFKYTSGRQELEAFESVPFGDDILEARKNTHVLAAVLPMSILDIRERVPPEIFYRHGDAWYNNEPFARKKGEAGWQLVSKTLITHSTSTNWHSQQKLLAQGEEVPDARVLVYIVVAHLLSAGKWLFDGLWASTNDAPGDDRVTVGTGILLQGGSVRHLYLSRTFDDCSFFLLGLSSALKS